MTDTIMTVAEFCKYLKVTRAFIDRNFLYRKDFPAFRVGRGWRIKAEKAQAYIEQKGRRIA